MSDLPEKPHAVPQFEPTRWSLVLRARGGDEAQRRVALEALCSAYWYPLYAFLRRSGRGVEDAEDLVQDFFARLLDGSLLERADQGRGKFRTLLLAAVKNLDSDARKAERTQKRGGLAKVVALDSVLAEERWLVDSSRESAPEVAFDRAWAAAILERAGLRLRAEHAGEKAALFAELAPRLTGSGEDGLAEIGAASIKLSYQQEYGRQQGQPSQDR